jgi:hypothetical protein
MPEGFDADYFARIQPAEVLARTGPGAVRIRLKPDVVEESAGAALSRRAAVGRSQVAGDAVKVNGDANTICSIHQIPPALWEVSAGDGGELEKLVPKHPLDWISLSQGEFSRCPGVFGNVDWP